MPKKDPSSHHQTQSADPVFVLIKGDAPFEWFIFSDSEMTIGRDSQNDIQLENITCSRVHARIVQEDSKIVIEDCGSTNGTYVNKKKIKSPTPLQHLDRIYLGGAEWLVYNTGESSELTPFLLIENVQEELRDKSIALIKQHHKDFSSENRKDDPSRETAYLHCIIHLFSKLENADELYDLLLEILFLEGTFDRGVVLTLDEESGQLIPKTLRNPHGKKNLGRIAICRKALERVISSGEILTILDASQDERFSGDFAIEVLKIQSLLCIPLQKKDTVIGLIYLDTRDADKKLEIQSFKKAMTICEQASVVIENTSLFQQIMDSEEKPKYLESVSPEKFKNRSRFVDFIPRDEVLHEQLKTSYVKIETLVEELLEQQFVGSLLLNNEKKLCRGFSIFLDGRFVACHVNGIHFKHPLRGLKALEAFWDIAHEPGGEMKVISSDKESIAAFLPLILDQNIYSNLFSEFIYVDRLLKIFQENQYTGCIVGEVRLRRINGIVYVFDGEIIGSMVGGETFPGNGKPFIDFMNRESAVLNVYVLESRRLLEEDLLSQLALPG